MGPHPQLTPAGHPSSHEPGMEAAGGQECLTPPCVFPALGSGDSGGWCDAQRLGSPRIEPERHPRTRRQPLTGGELRIGSPARPSTECPARRPAHTPVVVVVSLRWCDRRLHSCHPIFSCPVASSFLMVGGGGGEPIALACYAARGSRRSCPDPRFRDAEWRCHLFTSAAVVGLKGLG